MHPEQKLTPNSVGPDKLRTMEPIKPVAADQSATPIVPNEDLPQFQAPPPKKSRFDILPSILSTLALFLLAPLIAVFIAAFAIQSYQVDGQSMETTLQNNDRLIVDKWPRTWSRLTHHNFIPHRGDIIIFNEAGLDFSSGDTKQLIKRVVGLPGEHVVVHAAMITIYNKEHPEGFNPDKSNIYKIRDIPTPGDVDITLKSDELFVCGDNRPNSEDSRFFGPIRSDQIVGKLAFRIFPFSKAEHF